jgi:hypothetical protein
MRRGLDQLFQLFHILLGSNLIMNQCPTVFHARFQHLTNVNENMKIINIFFLQSTKNISNCTNKAYNATCGLGFIIFFFIAVSAAFGLKVYKIQINSDSNTADLILENNIKYNQEYDVHTMNAKYTYWTSL